MRIDKNQVAFKSIPDMFIKEKSGIKSNTIRILSAKESDNIDNCSISHIKIIEKGTGNYFVRKITDISTFQPVTFDRCIIYIFSW